MNKAYPDNPFKFENETAVPGGISSGCIRGCTPGHMDGSPTEKPIPNSDYVGDE